MGRTRAEPREVGRGPLSIPEVSAHDIYRGMRVRFVDDLSGDIGRVVGWEDSDPDAGVLESITVEWPNRGVVDYAPNEQAIQPVEGDA